MSGSQKKASLDSVLSLSMLKDDPLFLKQKISLGVAFNPYLPGVLFDDELLRIEKKIQSGLVRSIWIQFGTDLKLLKSGVMMLSRIISVARSNNSKISEISLFGSILIPSKQFIARFKFRPWKGVYCSDEFLESTSYANKLLKELLITYNYYNICPIIETNTTTDDQLNKLRIALTE